jgi:hypothetical protein
MAKDHPGAVRRGLRLQGLGNDLMALIRQHLPSSDEHQDGTLAESIQQEMTRLEAYLELCTLHKVKFQMDVLLSGIKRDVQQLQQKPSQLSQTMFDSLIQRLQTVLEIDADHPEARQLFQILQAEYPQYTQRIRDPRSYLTLAPYQMPDLCIEVTCQLKAIKQHERLQAIYQEYLIPTRENDSICRLQFRSETLDTFAIFHEELRMKPSYTVAVNHRTLDEQQFSDWFQCYRRFLKANTPQYCYGASPFTFNVFGCHKLYTPDVAKKLEQCWFQQGALDQESGLFFISLLAIAAQIKQHLEYCGFCPALNQEKLMIGMTVLPSYINPECDSRWHYYTIQGERVSVLPEGKEIAIATLNTDFSHPDLSTLIEVGPTPYVSNVLTYLDSNNAEALSAPGYRGFSTCVYCGAPYKLHTMLCSKCKQEFWKYALKNLEQALTQIKSRRQPSLHPQELPTQTPEPDIAVPAPAASEEKAVSFDQLWNDPQIQKLLSKSVDEKEQARSIESPEHPPHSEPAKSTLSPEEIQQALSQLSKSRAARRRKVSQSSSSSERLQFHEKIWSSISQKYRERKAIESAFSQPSYPEQPPESVLASPEHELSTRFQEMLTRENHISGSAPPPHEQPAQTAAVQGEDREKTALLNAIKSIKDRKKSELTKRGVVRVIYHATMDKDTCPLCAYLDGMVMDPDDAATDIFSPPLYPGCTCSREYVLKTEKPHKWPKVTFKFPPKELLGYLDKE